MRRLVLLLLLAVFGVMVYFLVFKQLFYFYLIIPIALLFGLYFWMTSVVSEKAVRKIRPEENFLFVKASMITNNGTELVSGALVFTSEEIIFYKRKGDFGGVAPAWSCFISRLEGYTLEQPDTYRDGITFSVKGVKGKTSFLSKTIASRESEMRKMLNWD